MREKFAQSAEAIKLNAALWLRQGSYDIEVRSPGRAPFTERIVVVNGKTLRLRPDAAPRATAPSFGVTR